MADIVVAGLMMAFAVLVLVDSIGRGAGWGADGPQPGSFPFAMAVLMLVGGAVVIHRAVRGRGMGGPGVPFIVPGGLRPMLVVLLPAVGMVVLTHVIGLYLAAMLYLTSYVRLIGGFGWRAVVAIGIVLPLAFWLVLDRVFLVPMPAGMFGGLLGF